jgi:hypothetical protein
MTQLRVQLDLRRLEIAESFAACAVRTYGEGHRRGRIGPNSPLPRCMCGLANPVGWYWPGSDAKEIARMAHQVAAMRGIADAGQLRFADRRSVSA